MKENLLFSRIVKQCNKLKIEVSVIVIQIKRHSKRFILVTLALAFGLLALGCAGSDEGADMPGESGSDASFPRTVVDVAGNEVNLEAKPVRIVSVVPSVTEILYDLNLDAEIVGVTENCDYPEIAQEKEKVGDWNINVEKLISLEPDLVVGMESTNAFLLDEISKLGINTLMIEAQSFEETYEAIAMIGHATGTEDRADEIVEDMKERVNAVVEKVAAIPTDKRASVFKEIGWEPLYSVGKGSLQHEIIELAGGVNIVEVEAPWVEYSNEKLIEQDPDVIILGTHPYYSAEQVMERTGWNQLKAVQEGQVVDQIDPNILVRPTYRAVEGLEAVAAALYPDLFN